MLKVRVGARNRGTICVKCGRKLGEAGIHAFVTQRGRAFCGDCDSKLEDSTVTMSVQADGIGFSYIDSLFSKSRNRGVSYAPSLGKSPISLCTQPKKHRRRSLSRCRRLSRELRETA